jgi:capsule polysaccharide modification protein KpsS
MTIPTSLDRLLRHRRTLMLQGPVGWFFARLARVLRAHGMEVLKVHFNGGDDWFWRGPGAMRFVEPMERWRERLRWLVEQHGIDSIVLFGQSRLMHEIAIREAQALGVTAFVFEEGYVRPDYITLEVGGVNGLSTLPRQREFYDRMDPIELVPPQPTHQEFSQVADLAITYALATTFGAWAYPHYRHHRSMHPIAEGLRWVRGGARKQVGHWRDRDVMKELIGPGHRKRWFLAPLQVCNDSQIKRFSPYRDVAQFIEVVMQSFARHAPREDWLVFKHHPLDRPYNDYTELIRSRALALGVCDRVRYVDDLHLPTLLKNACGVVTVNSTTGLQALYHGTPVMTLGECIYGVEGLVHAGPLEAFWNVPGVVDTELYLRFRAHLVRETQVNASFYAEAPGLDALVDSGFRPVRAPAIREAVLLGDARQPTAG